MALFSKLPARKPWHAKGAADSAPRGDKAGGTADKPAGGGITITGFGLVEPSPTRRVIEVTHGNAGLGAVLENAVLLFASGHADQARQLLSAGLEGDTETRASQLAWLSQFDLLQRAGDRGAFEQLAMQYVVQFERSAPTWDERVRPPAANARGTPGGFVKVTGKLTAASAAQIEPLRRAIAKGQSQARFDLAAISDFDDAGARLLAEVLGDARRRQYPLRLQRPDNLMRALTKSLKRGRDAGEGPWLLSLELLQWQNDHPAYDELAVDYAVTFEVSPPSWEPPADVEDAGARGIDAPGLAPSAADALADRPAPESDFLPWTGVVSGPHPEQVTELTAFADGREVVPIDMTEVERIDFVGAGAAYNAIKAIEERKKAIQIFGATPLIRAMLLLIGIAPGHFYKKAR